jgi:[protein-PII] uridylyltransferase
VTVELASGAPSCAARSAGVDAWLGGLFADATRDVGGDGLALVAIGGYGRAELCPHSDIDVMLLHDRHGRDVAGVADRIWYPIWDEGVHLGHSVSTAREAVKLAADDLDTATALLSARHVAGDERLTEALAARARSQWRARSKRWLDELAARTAWRHAHAGEVAFGLEPDLKDGRGGLRDVHSLRWAQLASPMLLDDDLAPLAAAYDVVLGVRVALQQRAGRAVNVLALQEQAGVAEEVGASDTDALMERVAAAARTIAWTSDDAWRRAAAERGRRRGGASEYVGDGLELRDGEIVATGAPDPITPLRAAAAAAERNTVVARRTLADFAAHAPPLPEPWPVAARDAFERLLLAGAPSVAVIEAIDQRGMWASLIPEWAAVRNRRQHNPYHRFTVDRHLLEAAARAAERAGADDRPATVTLAALLHDLGKGAPGDHTAAGVELAGAVLARMGYGAADIAAVQALIRHHLLLVSVATRRDLEDPATIAQVADAVGDVACLRRLAVLTEADAVATGPSAWTPWKANLVRQLVERVETYLQHGETGATTFPTAAHKALLAAPGVHREASGDVVTVVADDRPGLFSRVAGVLALHGLDVLAAVAYSDDAGKALSEFRVADPLRGDGATPWEKVLGDLDRALAGQLAVDARVAERARLYRRRVVTDVPGTHVEFHNDASTGATVVDVHTQDGVGVLYGITRALAELDLDIRSAKVQTLGDHVVDAFYVRDASGAKVTDEARLAELARAIRHRLDG